LRLGIYYLRKSVFLIFLNNHLTDYYAMTYCLKRKNKKRFFSFQSMPNLNFAELILSIPNYLPSRQGKSLDYILVSTPRTVLNAHRIFVMKTSDLLELLGPVPPAKQIRFARTKVTLSTSCKMPEFFEKSPLSGAVKHHNFQVTLCLKNDSTNVKFDD
jgi:hypothetical protein